MKVRGKPIPAPDWWVKLARAAMTKAQEGIGLVELGRQLAKVSARGVDYDHSVLSRFLNENLPPQMTQELADAISDRFPSVPRLYYVPRNENEARAMASIAEAYDHIDPVRSERKQQLDRLLRKMEVAVEDHRDKLDSRDADAEERRSGRRRPRGVPRSRSTPPGS
jgi:hypothetical protein